eukprot:g19109.t1
MLTAYCQDYLDDWDKDIPFILFAIRDAPNELTQFTPYELIFGHEVRRPLKLFNEKLIAPKSEISQLDYVSEIEKRLSQVNYLVKMPDRITIYRVCHVNMLKPYYDRERELEKQV